MRQLVWIPFDDAVRIVTMEMGGERMIGVMSGGGHVCVVKDSSFQVSINQGYHSVNLGTNYLMNFLS